MTKLIRVYVGVEGHIWGLSWMIKGKYSVERARVIPVPVFTGINSSGNLCPSSTLDSCFRRNDRVSNTLHRILTIKGNYVFTSSDDACSISFFVLYFLCICISHVPGSSCRSVHVTVYRWPSFNWCGE